MATYPSIFLVILLSTCYIICFDGISFTTALNGGFSVELIHRDYAAKSPFYKPYETPFQRVAKVVHRSIKHARDFYSATILSPHTPRSQMSYDSGYGEYLMSYSIGTPPFKIIGIADTGSDLIWSQCEPCHNCYNQTAPLFDPSTSKTYRDVPCSSKKCVLSVHTRCSNPAATGRNSSSVCEYKIRYGSAYSKGNIASETLTLGSTTTSGDPVSFPNIIIGCGYNNNGAFSSNESGIVGLGVGNSSLISQLGSSIGRKFSYCLVPYLEPNHTSKLNFGENAVVSGPGTVSTPIAFRYVFYYLTLEGMSVGNKRVEFVGSTTSKNRTPELGNILIDSGTTLTFLPREFYSKVESQVAARIKLERVQDPEHVSKLCYRSGSETIEAPIITAHFTGADVKLNSINTFLSFSEGVVCFTFIPAAGRDAIFGNLAQMNFFIGYDVGKKTLSFKPTDCTKM